MKLNLYLDKRQDKSGKHQVRLSVAFLGRRFITSLGVPMSDEELIALTADFNHTKPETKVRHPQHKELLRKLNQLSTDLDWEQQKVQRGEVKLDDVDFASIVNHVKGKETRTPKNQRTPVNTWLEFVAEEVKKKDLAEGTVSALSSFRKRFLEFVGKKTYEQVATAEFVDSWAQWNVNRGVSNNTTKSQVYYLIWFLTWSFRKGYCGDDFKRYHFELKTADKKENAVLFLTMEEIARVEQLHLDGNIAVARDIFLFQCFTGLRISDVRKLKKQDLHDGVLRLTIQKTGSFIENKLNNRAIAVAGKYAETAFDSLFPYLNTNSLELYLKQIGELAKIDEPIRRVDYRNHERTEYIVPKWQLLTTHVGRKTFVVNSLDLGLTATQVIGYTGHSSITAMQPYISISQKKKDAAMDVWDNATTAPDTEISKIEAEIKALEERLRALKSAADNQ